MARTKAKGGHSGTRRTRAGEEAALRRAARAAEHAPAPIAVYAEDGRVLYRNPAAAAAFGPAAGAGDAFAAQFVELGRAAEVRRAVAAEGAFLGEVALVTGRGPRWYVLAAHRADDPEGGGACLVTHSADASEKRRTETRFLEAIENSPAAIALYDADDRLVVCNGVYRRIFSIPGRLPPDRHRPGARFEDMLRIFTEAGGNPDVGPDKEAWIRARVARHRNPSGPIERHLGAGRWVLIDEHRTGDGGILAVISDISEFKRRERELAESEAQFRAVFEGSALGVVLLGLDGTIREANAAFRRMSGFDAGALRGRALAALAAPEDAEAVAKVVRDLVIGQPARLRGEFRYRRSNGRPLTLDQTTALVRDGEGRPMFLLATGDDITRRKKTELALRESERRLRAVTETAVDAILTTDEVGTVLTWNRGAASIFGLAARKAIGRPLAALVSEAGAGEAGGGGLTGLQRLLGDRAFHGRTVELTLRNKSGASLPVEVSLSGWNAQGERHYTFIVRDLTERKRAEEERAALTAQFHRAQKMEAIGTLAGGIAHDFNNVLGIILGYADIARLDAPAGSRLAEYLDHVVAAGERARLLVQQILAFSRSYERDFRPVHVETLLKETLALLRATLPTTVELSRDIPARLPPALADPGEIHQVLMNVVVNAYQAIGDRPGRVGVSARERMIDGGCAASLVSEQKLRRGRMFRVVSEADGEGGSAWVGLLEPGRHVAITVEDDGAGMDYATLERIFEPFFTTKAAGRGTGLGLPAAEGIVMRHDGAIRVKTQKGVGTIFTIFLPVHDEEGAPAPAPIPAGEALVGRERILVVDDEPLLARLAEQSLGRLGYRVEAMTSPLAALDAFRADPSGWDAVVTDQTMPQMTGADLTRELLALRRDLPVVICTGYSERIDRANLAALGVRALVMKPVGANNIAKIIREIFDGATTR
ncbi:MAG: PAS domain S-box protein [Proteobacteria bacterium]|nr:PAS domain S-box protein [Pseudomonadota bacterium]